MIQKEVDKFLKCDLHMHSSTDYSRNYSKDEFINKLISVDLDVVSITDHNIVDVAQGTAKLHQALIKDKRFDDKLYLLPAAQNTDKSALEPEEVKAIVEELKPDFDYILLDCPAGIEQGFMNANKI